MGVCFIEKNCLMDTLIRQNFVMQYPKPVNSGKDVD
jgi:hypothetical protein